MPSVCNPRSADSSIVRQIAANSDSSAASDCNAHSLAFTTSHSVRPAASASVSSSAAEPNANGTSSLRSKLSKPSPTTAPPPIERYSALCSTAPLASKAVKRMPFGCCGNVMPLLKTMSVAGSNAMPAPAGRHNSPLAATASGNAVMTRCSTVSGA